MGGSGGPRFDGQVAIVTGSAAGIGFVTAELLAQQGAAVHLTDIDEVALNEAVERLSSAGLRVSSWAANLTKKSEVDAMVAAALEAHDKVEILVNLAAIYPYAPFEELTLEEFHRVIAAGLDSTFLTCKAVVPHMRSRGYGRIVNTISTLLRTPAPETGAYVSSKGAILGFTRQLSTEVGPDGITANVVTPGLIATDRVLSRAEREGGIDALFEQNLAEQSVKRRGEPADVAHAIAYLASREASFVTGQSLTVSGGG